MAEGSLPKLTVCERFSREVASIFPAQLINLKNSHP